MAQPGLNNDYEGTLERAISELDALHIAASSSPFGSSMRNHSSYPISDLRTSPESKIHTVNNVNNANIHSSFEKRRIHFNTSIRLQPSHPPAHPPANLVAAERYTPLFDSEADFEGAESDSENECLPGHRSLEFQEEISRLKEEITTLKEVCH
jgi:hypothetical protein